MLKVVINSKFLTLRFTLVKSINIALACYFILYSNSIFSEGWFPELGSKPKAYTYRFSDTPVRQNFLYFPEKKILVSSQCAYKSGSDYVARKCMAYIPLENIVKGLYKEFLKLKHIVPPDPKNPREVSVFICVRSGGYLYSELNEFSRYGRQGDLKEFCGFDDGSMISLESIQSYL